MIGVAAYAASYNSSIKTHAHDTYMEFKPEEKKDFETSNKCCGFDVIEEGSENCPYKVPCGTTLEQMIQKYPKMAMTISSVGAGILVSAVY